MIFEKDRLALHRFMVEWDLSHKDVFVLVTIAQRSKLYARNAVYKSEYNKLLADGYYAYDGDRKDVTSEMGTTSVNYSIKKLEEIGAIRQRGTNRSRLIEIMPDFLEKIKSFCKL